MNTDVTVWHGGEVFDSAEEALQWSVEVLRRRRLPRLSRIWVEACGARVSEQENADHMRDLQRDVEAVAAAWGEGPNLRLPRDPDERLSLALWVMRAVDEIGQAQPLLRKTLLLWAMGDWADDARLRAALAFQDKMRREGMRVRISYRYSYEQLGRLLRMTPKSAWRRVQWGLDALGPLLEQRGLLVRPMAPVGEVVNFKKHVQASSFCGENEESA